MDGATATTTLTTQTQTAPSTGPQQPNNNPNNQQKRRPNPRPRNRQPQAEGAPSQTRPPRQNRPHRENPPSNEASTSSLTGDAGNNAGTKSQQPRNPRRRPPHKPAGSTGGPGGAGGNTGAAGPPPRRPENSRRAKFGAGLTTAEPASDAPVSTPAQPNTTRKPKNSHLPQGDDLTSSLIRDLSTPPYPDCPICFSSIRPEQAIWSCSPSIPIVTSSEQQVQQYCWTSFHVKCIRSWAEKSVKEVADAWRARGEPDRHGDWRCPGCQAKREAIPSGYWCFCNSTNEPKRLRLSTPHSCGNSCSRPRESKCGHPCPLQCHPGPCPPCQITTRLECYCPKKNILTFRCGIDVRGRGKRDLSCHNICERTLNCGKHKCAKICHEGDCGKCELKEVVTCWCGKEQKSVDCGEGKEVQCFVEGETPWIGRYGCDKTCDRLFDCGKHKCQKPCHVPSSKPAVCPRSPSKITHCPCGSNTIAPSPSADPSQYTFPARPDCTAPIPTCTSTCSKPHPACSHPCTAKCHNGPCPPCTVQIVRPCRCGGTTKSMPCYQVLSASASGVEEKEILCDKTCQALRACGRHQCNRVCCPLASLAMNVGKKGKKRAVEDSHGIGEERGGIHECDLVCGKMLSCGNHKCEARDHKGICPPCLRSSFEELVCACGRTVYEPPIPCGTKMQCHYPCPRPAPPCGHPITPHSCHDDSQPCPPCPSLADKVCACGKKVVKNVRCSLETDKISCGTTCGQLMSCGFHHCERACHSGDCGPCTAPCGKSRKSCLPNHHPCTRPCHAPSSCAETEPCQAIITVTCSCGRNRQSVHCGRTASSPPSLPNQSSSLKCTSDCEIAKRNARLAEALGINTDSRDKAKTGAAATSVTYNDELVGFARANSKFLPIVERAFVDFVTSEKRTQVLPHMPPDRRKFVNDLAAVYRMDTQMVDQEPYRSVQLLRRIDTRIPTPVLSKYIASLPPPPSLGKLADFRSLKSGSASPAPAPAASSFSWRQMPNGVGGGGAVAHTPSPKPPTPASYGQGGAGGSSRGWASIIAAKPPAATAASASAASSRPTTPLHHTVAGTVGSSSLRTGSPAPAPAPPVSNDPVPDSWEDDT